MKCYVCNMTNEKLYELTAKPYMITGSGCIMSLIVCNKCLEEIRQLISNTIPIDYENSGGNNE